MCFSKNKRTTLSVRLKLISTITRTDIICTSHWLYLQEHVLSTPTSNIYIKHALILLFYIDPIKKFHTRFARTCNSHEKKHTISHTHTHRPDSRLALSLDLILITLSWKLSAQLGVLWSGLHAGSRHPPRSGEDTLNYRNDCKFFKIPSAK